MFNIETQTVVGDVRIGKTNLQQKNINYYAWTMMKAGPLFISHNFNNLVSSKDIYLITSEQSDRIGGFAKHCYGDLGSNRWTVWTQSVFWQNNFLI